MSDDAPRSTQGNRPDQRRGRGAPPSWWGMLQRNDLPDDPEARDRVVDTAGWEVPRGFSSTRAPRKRIATAVSLIAAVLVAVAVAVAVWAATTMTGHGTGGTAAVVVGVPLALLAASLLASLASRRLRR